MWDEWNALISGNNRFKVDGANAGRAFVEKETAMADCDRHRKQRLYDAIAMHTKPRVSLYEETEAKATGLGIVAESLGPDTIPDGVPAQAQWDAVAVAYPHDGLSGELVNKMCEICRDRPATAFDNFLRDIRGELVDGYTRKGNRVFDTVMARTY